MKQPCLFQGAATATTIVLTGTNSAPATPLGTAFSCRCQLRNSGGPDSGQYDMRFRLYGAGAGDPQAGITLVSGVWSAAANVCALQGVMHLDTLRDGADIQCFVSRLLGVGGINCISADLAPLNSLMLSRSGCRRMGYEDPTQQDAPEAATAARYQPGAWERAGDALRVYHGDQIGTSRFMTGAPAQTACRTAYTALGELVMADGGKGQPATVSARGNRDIILFAGRRPSTVA